MRFSLAIILIGVSCAVFYAVVYGLIVLIHILLR